jgi:hypothetical protein
MKEYQAGRWLDVARTSEIRNANKICWKILLEKITKKT